MDTNERIHIELLKRIKIFSEIYASDKSHTNHKKKHNNSPIIYPKNPLFQKLPLNDDEKVSSFLNFKPKYKLYNLINQLKNDHKKHSSNASKHNYQQFNSQLINNFHEKIKTFFIDNKIR